MEYITLNEKETQELVKELVKDNNVFVLEGELGAGKTTFVKGLENVLGIKIKSPTFNIINRYEIDYLGYTNLYHIDFYRVNSVEGLDFNEIINNKKNLVFIEWGSNVEESIPKNATNIKFEYIDKNKRKIII
jgi:tRNA threonylcarbamoyladenosine biosynthesis protein TsaE